MIELAAIGAGRWGKKLVKAFAKFCRVRAVSVAGGQEEVKAWLKSENLNVAVLPVEKILLDQKISAVAVAVPTKMHREIGIKVLEADKNLFIEKPAGTSLEEAESLLKKADEKKLIAMVGYVFLHHPAIKKITSLLSERGEEPQSIYMNWQKWGTFETPIAENLLSHEVSIALKFFPDIKNIRKISGSLVGDELGVEFFDSEGGAVGKSEINRRAEQKKKTVRIIGQKGSVFIWQDDELFEQREGVQEKVEIEKISALDAECLAFVQAIKSGTRPEASLDLALQVHKLLTSLN